MDLKFAIYFKRFFTKNEYATAICFCYSIII